MTSPFVCRDVTQHLSISVQHYIFHCFVKSESRQGILPISPTKLVGVDFDKYTGYSILHIASWLVVLQCG